MTKNSSLVPRDFAYYFGAVIWGPLLRRHGVAHALDGRGWRFVDLLDQRRDLLATERIDLDLQLVGFVQELLVLHHRVESPPDGVDPLGRHVRRHEQRSPEFQPRQLE